MVRNLLHCCAHCRLTDSIECRPQLFMCCSEAVLVASTSGVNRNVTCLSAHQQVHEPDRPRGSAALFHHDNLQGYVTCAMTTTYCSARCRRLVARNRGRCISFSSSSKLCFFSLVFPYVSRLHTNKCHSQKMSVVFCLKKSGF